MPGQHDLRINLSGLEGDARKAAAGKASGTEFSPPGMARTGSGTFLTALEQDILNSSRRRGRNNRIEKQNEESLKSPEREDNDFYLPAITTPRQRDKALIIPAVPEEEAVHEKKRRVQPAPAPADVGPDNVVPLMKEVVRRYYFRQVEEKPMAFLQHYDVVLPAHERSEKLVGGHVPSNDSELMRFYYCDFLHVPPFEGEMPFEEGAELDIDTCVRWVQQFHPRTRMDAYPLFLLLKGILKRFLKNEYEVISRKTRELKLEVSSLKDDRLELVRTVARTRTELGKQLAETSEKLADVEQQLSRERAKRLKEHARVDVLAKQLEAITKDRDEMTHKLEQLKGQQEFELFKKNLADKKAAEGAAVQKKDDDDDSPLPRTASASSDVLSEGGDTHRSALASAGSKDPTAGKEVMTPRQRKCANLIQSLNMAERIECLNRLAAQPMVLAKIDAKKLASEASSEVKDMLLKQITEKIHADQKGDLDGASLMSRVKGTERSDEALLALQGVKRHLGYNEAATVAAKAMADTADERMALLQAAVELCKGDPGFWDKIADASQKSKSEMVKEVVGQDPAANGVFRALMQEGSRKVNLHHGLSDVDIKISEDVHHHHHHHHPDGANPKAPWLTAAAPAPLGGGRQNTFRHVRRRSGAGFDLGLHGPESRQRRRSIQASPDELAKTLHALRVESSGSGLSGGFGSDPHTTSSGRLMTPSTFMGRMAKNAPGSSPSPQGTRQVEVEDKEVQTEEAWPEPVKQLTKHLSKKKLQDFVAPPSAAQKEPSKPTPQLSIPAALKHIATIVQAKMDQDKQSDLHKRQRQTMQECVRDFFTQRYGLASVAKQKLAELIATVLAEASKKTKPHTRIWLFHVLMGLAEQTSGQETSIDECNFMLALIQELFPSWRYGSAFIKDFSQTQILLQLDVVEFTLERLFAAKKYGGVVPLVLLNKIRGAAFVANEPKKTKPGEKKGARQKALEAKEGDKLVDTDVVLELCHFQYREMEIKSITALMSMMADVDENGDGVLQFDEFADLLLKIDPMFTSQDVLEMYHECVGDDDVVDKDELMHLITERGLRFAVYTRAVGPAEDGRA